jgi:hypothetical protein
MRLAMGLRGRAADHLGETGRRIGRRRLHGYRDVVLVYCCNDAGTAPPNFTITRADFADVEEADLDLALWRSAADQDRGRLCLVSA